jgi:hypothetical protein
MAAQEPVDTKQFLTSFKGFMDQAVAQAPVKELALEGGELTRRLLGASRAF